MSSAAAKAVELIVECACEPEAVLLALVAFCTHLVSDTHYTRWTWKPTIDEGLPLANDGCSLVREGCTLAVTKDTVVWSILVLVDIKWPVTERVLLLEPAVDSEPLPVLL